MTSSPEQLGQSHSMASYDLIKQARQIADLGDRWFLGVARGLGRIGVWARSEADVAAESARAALATTVDVTRRLTLRERPPAPDDAAREEPVPNPARTSGPQIDVLDANPVESPRKRRHRGGGVSVSAPRGASNPPGLVPLLRALGRVVAVHSPDDYAALERDERFWTLLSVLHSLKASPLVTEPHGDRRSAAVSPDSNSARPASKGSRLRTSRQP